MKKFLEWLKSLFKKWNTATTTTSVPVTPDPNPTPEPNPNVTADDIDMSTVIFDDKNISKWPITAKLSDVVIHTDGSVHAKITGTDKWPVRNDGGEKPSIGNWHIIAPCSDDKYHDATYEWLKKNATTTVARAWDGNDAIHGRVGTDFRPKKGDIVYIVVSTVARAAPYTIEERSQAVKVVWP